MRRFLFSLALLLAFCVPWAHGALAASNLTDVSANTKYGFNVRSYCSASDQSNSALFTFSTACPPDGETITEQHHLTNNFENVTTVISGSYYNIPDGWSKINDATSSSYQMCPCIYNSSTSSDYLDDVDLSPMPTCFKPTGITVSGITNNQATLSWTPGASEAGWTLQYKASGDDNWSLVNVTNPYTLTGLEANETYTFKMQSDCWGEQSEWTNEATFKTLCNPFTPEGLGTVSFETSEGFTTGQGNMANCWTVGNMQSTSTSYIPYVETSYGHTGSNCMLINGYNSSSTNADSAYAVMPPMVFDEDITSYQVKFWMKKCNASSNYNDTLYVGIVSDPSNMSSLQIVGYAVNTTTIYNNYNVVFSNYTGGTSGYIVFLSAVAQNSTATDKYAQFYVDDVTVEIPGPDTLDYLHFVSLRGGKLRLNKQGRYENLDAELEYSKDRITWTTYHWNYFNGDEITTQVHDTVWFRAGGDSHKNAFFSRANSAFYYFKITNDNMVAGGNIMSLLDASCQQDSVPEYAFIKLFSGCSALKSAPRLPATKLASNCYALMFHYCSALTTAPELPATHLAEDCYNYMFQACSSLLEAPELPATTMKKGCYSYMFIGCSSLASVPKLQSTDLAEDCYGRMFQNCDKLTDLPELPAEVLPKGCYYEMFIYCDKLKLDTVGPGKPWSVPASTDLGTEWNKNMFSGTAGTFTGAPTAGTVYYIRSAPKVKVTKQVNDVAMGSITGPDSVYVSSSDTLVAVANAGFRFTGWDNGTTNDTLIISIDKDSTIGATFEPAEFSYTLSGNVNELYSGMAKSVSVTVTTPATGATVQYSTDKGTTWTAGSSVSRTNAGTDTVRFKISADGFTDTITSDVVLNVNAVHLSSTSIAPVLDQTYTGDSIKPGLNITLGSYSLVAGTDYTVSYMNNVEIGTATATATGIGNFTGTASKNFIIALDTTDYFYLTATKLKENSTTKNYIFLENAIEMSLVGINLQYTKDKQTWTDYSLQGTTGEHIIMAQGDTVWFRAGGTTGKNKMAISGEDAYQFKAGSGIDSLMAGGNIMSLLDATCQQDSVPEYGFCKLFYTLKQLKEANFKLSFRQVGKSGYQQMFLKVTGLKKVPVIEADTLGESACSSMFNGCVSLIETPELPTTKLGKQCYSNMFDGCTGLITIRNMPADSLPDSVYKQMYRNCSKLKISETGPGTPWMIPSTTKTGTNWNVDMFNGTSGTFTGNPVPGVTYYISTAPKVKVTKTVNDANMGSIVGPDSVYPGYTDTLVAVANAGFRFTGWDNGTTNDTLIISIDKDSTFTANFEEDVSTICSIGTTTYTTIADAIAAAQTGDTIRMLADATENVTIASNDTLILDLNGKILKPQSNGSPTFTISGKLTLTDNSVNVKHYFSQAANSLWMPSEKATATDSVTGGVITGATNKTAVLVDDGYFVMEKGNIVGNNITETGAGVYMAEWRNNNQFEMKGGCIVGNVARYGGGVAACNGTFTMTGGEICNNNAQSGLGGGVIVKNTGNFVMTGGKVTDNNATIYGGGVYFEAGTITLGGTAKIIGNTMGTAECNLTLLTNKTFAVSSTPFANGANIGVTTSDLPTLGNPVAISSNGAATDVPYFMSDNSNYVVNFNTNHLELAVPVCEIHNGTAVVSHYATVQSAVNAASTGDTIRMIANSTENVSIYSNDTLTLDLNGKVLKGTGSGSVVTVNDNASFTLTDGDSTSVHYYTVGSNGVWSWIASPTAAQTSGATAYDSLTARPASDAVIAVKGGAITGGVSGWCGGGVIVAGNNGCFTMNGGNVIGNVSSVFGGGVSIRTEITGTAQINGGRIIGNNGKCGGGVHGHTNTSTLIVTGGDISFNYGWDSGGGIKPYAMFSMTGGQVRYNYSPKGGGLDCEAGSISILGGSIIHNMANSAGGVRILNCALTLGGDAQITANTLVDGTTASNLWLQNGKTATISDVTPLNGANIGISTQNAPTVSTPIVVSSNGVQTDEQYFTADAQGKEVKFVNNRLVLRYRDFQFTLGNSIDTIYTATAHSVSVNVTTPATGATVKYSTDKGSTWTDGASVSRTNVGTDTVKFKISAAGWADTITDAVVLNVTKRAVTMTSASNSKTFDGTALTDDNVTVTGESFIEGEGATYNVTGSQTNVGSSANTFTYTLKSGTLADNYDIDTTYGTLTVNAVHLSSTSIAPVLDQIHTGDSIKPGLTITFNGDTLVENTDYTVAYSDNVNVGTATATATGIGNFTGTASKNFTIVPDTFLVTVNVNDPTMGRVTGGGRYPENSVVTLTATPSSNDYRFVNWSNGETARSIQFTVTKDTTLTATFIQICGAGIDVPDYDGNIYGTVSINGRCWLSENLRTLHYADGSAVANQVIYSSDLYPDTAATLATYGRLYSWYSAVRVAENDNVATPTAVNGNVQGVCPDGWHLPSQSELQALLAYTASELQSTTTWIGNPGNNSTGFNAVAAGYYNGTRFENLGGNTYFWSNTNISVSTRWACCSLQYGCQEGLIESLSGDCKLSVRCVKNE